MRRILDLGSGKNPYEGKKNEEVIHLDTVKLPHVEVVHDLNKFPWPFKDNEFDEVIARHVLEHLDDLVKVMREIWRILKPNGILKVWVPYFASVNAYTDPTHKHFFTLGSFDYWDPKTSHGSFLGHQVKGRFAIRKKELVFPRIYRVIGVHILAKEKPTLYEVFLSRIFPAYEMFIELEAIK